MNYKPFDLAQAKAGKPVITRDGSPARIVCFDRKSKYPIFGFVGKRDEHTCSWDEKGKTYNTHTTANAIRQIIITALQEYSAWKPIETAPKDGTRADNPVLRYRR